MSPTGDERDHEAGEPIRELAGLREEGSAGFLDRVRRRIHRRRLASNVLDLLWSGPALVFLEFLNMVFGLLGRGERPRGETD